MMANDVITNGSSGSSIDTAPGEPYRYVSNGVSKDDCYNTNIF